MQQVLYFKLLASFCEGYHLDMNTHEKVCPLTILFENTETHIGDMEEQHEDFLTTI